MSILDKLNPIGTIAEKVMAGIDALTTSGEEKLAIKADLLKLQNEATQAILDYESRVIEARSSIILAEAKSSSWIAKNWRPITMLDFLAILNYNLILAPAFGWERMPMPDWIGTLFVIGFGGYIAGRSGEQIAKTVTGQGLAQLTLPADIKAKRKYEKMLREQDRKDEKAGLDE